MSLRRDLDASDWVRGSRGAQHVLIEYGDFECPMCGQAYWELKRLEEALGDRVAIVFRHFPLAGIHPHAQLCAEAAEAAGAQGRFWQMHDLLFENQEALETPALVAYASNLGLDLHRFRTDLREHRHQRRVRRDFIEGVRSGVNGTPTFFIDSQRYVGVRSAEALAAALEGPEVGHKAGLHP
jgi:protein-disulfide isomerase